MNWFELGLWLGRFLLLALLYAFVWLALRTLGRSVETAEGPAARREGGSRSAPPKPAGQRRRVRAGPDGPRTQAYAPKGERRPAARLALQGAPASIFWWDGHGLPGDGAGRWRELAPGDTVPLAEMGLGRATDQKLRVTTGYTSAHHAAIGKEGSGFWVEDLISANGTFVNGCRIEERRYLYVGDVIEVGQARFSCEE